MRNGTQNRSIVGIDYTGITTTFYCFDENGQLLLHKRSKNCRDEKGMWDTGSGKLEFGVSPEENVLREIEEEYGCKAEIQEVMPAISVVREHEGQKTHWVAIPFIVRVVHDEAKLNEPDKMTEIGWFDLDNLPSPLQSAFENCIIKTDRIKLLERYSTKKDRLEERWKSSDQK